MSKITMLAGHSHNAQSHSFISAAIKLHFNPGFFKFSSVFQKNNLATIQILNSFTLVEVQKYYQKKNIHSAIIIP